MSSSGAAGKERKASGLGGELQKLATHLATPTYFGTLLFSPWYFQIFHGLRSHKSREVKLPFGIWFQVHAVGLLGHIYHLLLWKQNHTSRKKIKKRKKKKDCSLGLIHSPSAFRMFFLILQSEIFLLVSSHQPGCSSLLWPRAINSINSPNLH